MQGFLLKIHTSKTLRGVYYDELCRIAAHNLAERQKTARALAEAREGKSTKSRQVYLSRLLGELNKEKQILLNKEKFIRKFKGKLDKFII